MAGRAIHGEQTFEADGTVAMDDAGSEDGF
jgi:hypothetical protein